MTIIEATTTEQVEVIRTLFREYADSLGFDLDFQDFETELAGLPGEYAKPEGCLLLAIDDTTTAGCVALRRIDSATCEMKRLYVRPEFRKTGLGRELSIAVIDHARQLGYKRMLLDTLASMTPALNLYHSLGFLETEPYRFNPLPGATFLSLEL